MRSTDVRPRLLAFVACTLLVAACGTSGGSDAASSTTRAKTTTTRVEKTTTTDDKPTTTAEEGPTKAQLEAFIDKVLLTPDDVGVDGLVASTPDGSTKAPCGLDLERDFPASGKGSVVLGADDKGVAVQESIRAYDTEAEAKAAYEAALDTGLGCPESIDGTIKIAPIGDVSAAVAPAGVELEAQAFSLDSSDFQGSAFVIHYSDSLVVLQFATQPGAAELGGLPDVDVVAMAAMAKIDSNVPG